MTEEDKNLDKEYLDKYGCTHKQLLDKFRILMWDEFKTLVMVYNLYAGVTYIDNRIVFD